MNNSFLCVPTCAPQEVVLLCMTYNSFETREGKVCNREMVKGDLGLVWLWKINFMGSALSRV